MHESSWLTYQPHRSPYKRLFQPLPLHPSARSLERTSVQDPNPQRVRNRLTFRRLAPGLVQWPSMPNFSHQLSSGSRHAFCCSLVRYCSGLFLPRGARLWHFWCHFCASHERTTVNPGLSNISGSYIASGSSNCLRDVFLRIQYDPFSQRFFSKNIGHAICFVEHLADCF
jgi:hypothetical protein